MPHGGLSLACLSGKDFLSLKPTPGGPLCCQPNWSLLDADHRLRESRPDPRRARAARTLEGRRKHWVWPLMACPVEGPRPGPGGPWRVEEASVVGDGKVMGGVTHRAGTAGASRGTHPVRVAQQGSDHWTEWGVGPSAGRHFPFGRRDPDGRLGRADPRVGATGASAGQRPEDSRPPCHPHVPLVTEAPALTQGCLVLLCGPHPCGYHLQQSWGEVGFHFEAV